MMTSYQKRLAVPPLQLLALVLILGAGLLPKNSPADEGTGDAGAGTPPTTNGTGAVTTPNSNSTNASGSNSNGSVECWLQSCDSAETDQKISTEDCLKKPAIGVPGVTKVKCPSGYCFQYVKQSSNGVKSFGEVDRDCVDVPALLECLKPDTCMLIDLSSFENQAEDKKYVDCATPLYPGRAGRSKEPISDGYLARCICKGDLCNDRVSSGPTGVKRVGFNVALVGALLVSIFPLRSLFLVG